MLANKAQAQRTARRKRREVSDLRSAGSRTVAKRGTRFVLKDRLRLNRTKTLSPTPAFSTVPRAIRPSEPQLRASRTSEPRPAVKAPSDPGKGFRVWIPVIWALAAVTAVRIVWSWWYPRKRRSQVERVERPPQPALPPPNSKRPPLRPLVPVDPVETVLEAEPVPLTLTEELLVRLEWRRFEVLMQGYFDSQQWKAQRSRVGADGGIDLFLYRPGEGRPAACVQCKAWTTMPAGVKPVRELFGVMAAEGISEGYFVCTYGYTAEARAFAEGKALHLWSGADILTRFQELPESARTRILAEAYAGDFETPTCPSCDEKMILRQADKPFWGCRRYPRCRRTFTQRREPATSLTMPP